MLRWGTAILLFVLLLSSVSCSSVSDGKESGEKEKEADAVMYKVDPIVLNLNDPGYDRIVKMSMDLELAGPAAAEKAKAKTPAVRDAIISLVTCKTFNTLVSPEGKVMLKDEITGSLNRILGEKSVRNVYITDFIVQ